MQPIQVTVQIDIQPERVQELVRICFDPALNTIKWGEAINSVPGDNWWEIWVSVPRLIEEEPVPYYVLDPNAIEKGLQVMADQLPEFFSNILNEDLTPDTADAFLQCCLFGGIVFGRRFDIL